jgi:hypothetical protein
MLRVSVLTIALVFAIGPVALAQLPPQPPPVQNPSPMQQGTEQERAACHPDVMRYCRQFVQENGQDDVFAILSCLQTNRTRISRACSTVLTSHGQ